MKTTLSAIALHDLTEKLSMHNASFDHQFPYSTQLRQPVHTLYGGADRFSINAKQKFGEIALATLARFASDGKSLAEVLALTQADDSPAVNIEKIYQKVIHKLKHDALEDLRIDFEDGYGYRPDAEEDKDAKASARLLAAAFAQNTLPAFVGIRIKTLSKENMQRAIRTLDIFLSEYKNHQATLPLNFVVTLPKVNHCTQIATLVSILDKLGSRLFL